MTTIIQSPNPILRTPTQPVDFFDSRLSKIILEMTQTLQNQKNPSGVGLAANQIGYPYRLFVARFTLSPKEPIKVFINPEVVDHSKDLEKPPKKSPLEGCLSLPQYYGTVDRYNKICIKYYVLSIKGLEEKIETFTDFPATVVQHELDHLDGKIFVERIIQQQGKLYKVTGKGPDGKEDWEEVAI